VPKVAAPLAEKSRDLDRETLMKTQGEKKNPKNPSTEGGAEKPGKKLFRKVQPGLKNETNEVRDKKIDWALEITKTV